MSEMKHIGLAGLLVVIAAQAFAAPPPCTGITEPKSKSRLYFDGTTLMTSLLALQAQGEAAFHPAYAKPVSECVFEEIAGATPVTAIYTPFEAGEHTLHWRFTASGTEAREILVIHDGVASLMSKKGPVLFVIEERKGSISWYAMFRDEPTLAALKPLVSGILDGTAAPLATVHWPAGAKEPLIDAYDSKRMK
jgi:hypothetical protein